MLRKKRIVTSAVVAVAALAATPSSGSINRTIYLHAFVPVYCNVELTPSLGGEGGDGIIDLGQSQEFCNAPRGYRIILEHPTDLAQAAVISDAIRIPLSETGETILADSDQPGIQLRNLALDPGQGHGSISRLGLRMEVKY